MKTTIQIFAALLVATLCFSSPALAARDQESGNSLIFSSGPADKPYNNFVNDIVTMCSTEQNPLMNKVTGGGAQNIFSATSRQSHIGIADANTLVVTGDQDTKAKLLKVLFAAYPNYLHILTNPKGVVIGTECSGVPIGQRCAGSWKSKYGVITNVSQLQNLNINVAVTAGAAEMLVNRLRSVYNFKINAPIIVKNDAEGFKKVLDGEAAVFFTMQGYDPKNTIAMYPNEKGKELALVNWDIPPKGFYFAEKRVYQNFGLNGVDLLGVRNIVFARGMDPSSDIGKRISQVQACVVNGIEKFRKSGEMSFSGWEDVELGAIPEGMTKWIPVGGAPNPKKTTKRK